MTPTNLQRHLSTDLNEGSTRKVIITTRDEQKGRYGDLFHIEGLENPYVLMSIESFDSVCEWVKYFCEEKFYQEGFDSADALLREVMKIYPNAEKLHVHMFAECFESEEKC